MAVTLSGMTLYTNNDNETNWGGTDGPDTYNVAIQGTNSESWLVSKNATETGTLTLAPGTAPDTTRGLFVFWMKSDLSYYYTDIKTELESTASNYKTFTVASAATPDISGDFHAIALDYVNKGIATGTYAPASHTVTRAIVNNSASGNIRSVINNWIDAMYFGAGHVIAGTTTGDALFTEAAVLDQNGTNEYGILNNVDDIIFSQGDIDLAGTALTSEGETLVFIDTANGYDRYNLDITGTVIFANTGIVATGTVDFDMDATSATSFSMTGGTITQANALTLIVGQTLADVVLTDINTSSIANDPSGCTWNLSGLITVTGSLTECTINKGTGTSAVNISDVTNLDSCSFISDGTGHGINLGTISVDDSQTWNCADSGYTAASSGNETILVSVNSGITLTIVVASGATTPSVYNTGIGNVVINSDKTITFTGMKDSTEVRIYKTSDNSIIDGIENATAGTIDARTFAWSAPATTEVYYILHNWKAIEPFYQTIRVEDYVVPSTDTSIAIQQQIDRNAQ